jgi:hypothetical protein
MGTGHARCGTRAPASKLAKKKKKWQDTKRKERSKNMQLNFSADDYDRLCLVADYHGTTPAWLARHWVIDKLTFEEVLIAHRHRVGNLGREQEPNPESQPTEGTEP